MRPHRPPNILLITVHDLGAHLHCYGHSSVRSPHLDAFAARGVRFTNHFATAPFCSPSRGALVTGMWPHANGLMGLVNLGWDLPEINTVLGQMLGAAGYDTFLFGLQHEVRDVARLGFHHVESCASRRCGDVAPAVCRFLADRAASGNKAPFYARVGVFEVHRLGNGYMPYADRAPDPARIALPPFLKDTPGARTEMAQFHACIEEMDRGVGTIFDAVEESGLADRTIVAFVTDHGIDFPRAKATLYDPGIRTALLMRRPGRWDGGAVYDHLVSNIDLAPTLLEAAGVSVPSHVQGRSFKALLDHEGYGPTEMVFAEKNTTADDTKRCVRTRRWKYIRNFDEGPLLQLTSGMWTGLVGRDMGGEHLAPRPETELYDLAADPNEFNNLAGRPEVSGIEAALAARLREWMAATGDPLIDGPVPRPPEEAERLRAVRRRKPNWQTNPAA